MNQRIDPAATINETITRFPSTVAVFNRYGFDTCCGGFEPIEEAARRDGVDIADLIEELSQATAESVA